MTEPPQPPNQPPTPSGYGHLPGPPQPQGYGYPQAGENPYAQPAPYPQQPPTVPQQQAGHGYPPPPPGAPGATPKKKTTLLIAASVAAVLVLGTVGYVAFFMGDEDPKKPVAQESTDAKPSASPSVDKGDGNGGNGHQTDLNSGRKQGEDKVLWLKTTKIDGPGAGVTSKGQWIVGDTVAKTIGKTVNGYAVADGKEKWTITLPAEICGMADRTTDDGKTLVMYRGGPSDTDDCNQLKMIDLKAGKEGWSKEVTKESDFDMFLDPSLAMTGDTVTVNRLTRATAFRISTGDKLFASPAEGCVPSAYAAGSGKLIGVATCYDADRTVEVQDADPVTGKKTWTHKLPKGWRVTRVYALDPIVLDLANETSKERSIVVLGPDGKKRTSLSGDGNFSTECSVSHDDSLQGCATAVVDAGTLYLPTEAGIGKANEIVAFDLTTGKAKWRVPAGEGRTLVPLKAANGQLIAYRKAETDRGGEVLSIPADGSTPTALLRHPSGPAAPIESTFYSPEVDYVDGRFFISASRLLAQDKDEKFLMVFGK
ncbi:outer membrane protein assembly factor BamB family protein [Streptomyces sp. NBC_01294]|uniref:outer membrane protein assembly factor BamB family protein n=1 Tax=Streptomyces sp. NBC_01294 TaxID=2903815 RepID=UPI002DD871D1|nr:PQQ-binding-like beta-propeller repeat protein [Streptomyces sp. NBC_01294]WRZ58902.1 PQQ-binding-like beta-propeller repeat protein [Streptomyces sp. NBC_01294]